MRTRELSILRNPLTTEGLPLALIVHVERAFNNDLILVLQSVQQHPLLAKVLARHDFAKQECIRRSLDEYAIHVAFANHGGRRDDKSPLAPSISVMVVSIAGLYNRCGFARFIRTITVRVSGFTIALTKESVPLILSFGRAGISASTVFPPLCVRHFARAHPRQATHETNPQL